MTHVSERSQLFVLFPLCAFWQYLRGVISSYCSSGIILTVMEGSAFINGRPNRLYYISEFGEPCTGAVNEFVGSVFVFRTCCHERRCSSLAATHLLVLRVLSDVVSKEQLSRVIDLKELSDGKRIGKQLDTS